MKSPPTRSNYIWSDSTKWINKDKTRNNTSLMSKRMIMFLLSMSGVLSSIESMLLALVHFSHGPLMHLMHGVFLFIGDGVKLYSKFAVEMLNGVGMFLFVTLCCSFMVALISFCVDFGVLNWFCSEFEMIFSLACMGLIGLGVMLGAMTGKSKYVAIGSLRALKAFAYSEMCFDTALFIFLFHSSNMASSAYNSTCFFMFMFMFNCLMMISMFISTGRAPFDLGEAESELMAGNMTEVGGVAFSFLLLVDYCEMIITVSVLNLTVSTLLALVISALLMTLWLYLGSILLCRLYIFDLGKLVYCQLCWLLGFTLM